MSMLSINLPPVMYENVTQLPTLLTMGFFS